VAVTGFDNADEAELCSPSLSSVSLLYSDVGRLAASLMLEMVSGHQVPSEPHVMPAHLVVRSSCGCRPENSPLAGAQSLDGIAGQLCSSLGDRGARTLVAADSFVVTLADHIANAATEDDLAALPGTVLGLARELVLVGTGMATVSAMTQAARQVAARRRGLISAAAFAGLPRLLAELGGECTRILLHRRAVTVSRRPQEARDWFDVSVELLRAGSNARSLRWLRAWPCGGRSQR
jgi:hypothetical protein